MSIVVRNTGGDEYSGKTYAEIVEQMRAVDINSTPNMRAYIAQATVRAGWLGHPLRVTSSAQVDDEALAKQFVDAAVKAGLLFPTGQDA